MASEVGRRMRELRRLRGLSQEELAERAGLTLEAISRAERGRSEITISSLVQVCEAMGLHLSEFFARHAPPAAAAPQSRAAARLLSLIEDVPDAELRRVLAIMKLVLQPPLGKGKPGRRT